ncbi:MAG: hypothetical protein AAGA68_07755 [Pseudomonadota bacterium]
MTTQTRGNDQMELAAHNTAHSTRRFSRFISVIAAACSCCVPLSAATLYESATLGETGSNTGFVLDSDQFLGSRFSLSRTSQITAVGGHIDRRSGATLWGAIVEMSDVLPTFEPAQIEANVVASVVFTAPDPSDDLLTPLSLVLGPGDYALIFGGGAFFGADGDGVMPSSNTDTADGVGSYFFSIVADNTWFNGGLSNARFVVEGFVVPVPAALWLLGSGLLASAAIGRRRRAATA